MIKTKSHEKKKQRKRKKRKTIKIMIVGRKTITKCERKGKYEKGKRRINEGKENGETGRGETIKGGEEEKEVA